VERGEGPPKLLSESDSSGASRFEPFPRLACAFWNLRFTLMYLRHQSG
jgi:hypothetical protein